MALKAVLNNLIEKNDKLKKHCRRNECLLTLLCINFFLGTPANAKLDAVEFNNPVVRGTHRNPSLSS